MRVIVIPDVHLKPYLFTRTSELMKEGIADKAVCLMDISDDWNQQYNISLYEDSYDAAISFAKEFPDTLWCYGNHDLSYVWNKLETGFSTFASYTVQKKIIELKEIASIRYVHRIDDILFSHGGLCDCFVLKYAFEEYEDVEATIAKINDMGPNEIWTDISPIWHRPQYSNATMYCPNMLQIVGHTPMKYVEKKGNVISTDVFSTYSDGKTPIGNCEFLVINTKTQDYFTVK